MEKQTRIFFVVDSIEDNEEIFDTLEKAQAYHLTLHSEDEPRISVAMVRNAYKEDEKDEHVGTQWNYEDLSDTFTIIKTLTNK